MSNPVIERPSICLSMIVRDEAHIIVDALNSVAPYISSWVIVDTGSTDGTQDLITNHMAQLGIPGELYERPWRDFGQNRSEALALAQHYGHYIWVMDADDRVVGTPDFTRLSADVYSMRRLLNSDTTYWQAQLFRDGLPVGYAGVTHEYVRCDQPYTGAQLPGQYYIEDRQLSARNRSGEKYARDRDLLLAEVKNNPKDARSVFYLAQSYFDLGDFATARTWYARRVELGGWDEEVYFAMFRIAVALQELGEPLADVQDAYLKAWAFRPSRAEPLLRLANLYRDGRYNQLGYLFAKLAAELPYPERETLFINADVYAWRALDEQAAYAARINKHAEAFTICRGLLARPDISEEDRQRVATNRDVSAPTMIDAAAKDPDTTLLQRLVAYSRSHRQRGPRETEVAVSLIGGPDLTPTEQTLNSFLNCCTDISRASRFRLLDAGLSAHDRATLLQRYGFLEVTEPGPVDQPAAQLAHLHAQLDGRFWLHLGAGWRFFAPENLITRLTAVLQAEPQVFQVGINFADAVKLTGSCAGEPVVRRAPDAGRYVLTQTVANGPSMFDTTRLDHSAGLRTASLDEVLCVAAS